MSKLCISEGCSSPAISRGLCGAHYMKDKRAGLFLEGPIPDGMVVMHKCDNPDHLEAGTHSQNIKDAFARMRKILPI